MRLETDYAQWYDEVFDGTGATFHRQAFARGGLTKRAQFALFQQLGLATPPHGHVADLAASHRVPPAWAAPARAWIDELEVVVYLDELGHAGAGKIKLALGDALTSHPRHFASLFIPLRHPAVILRHVRFGRLACWLRQEGGEDWRSNRGDRERVVSQTISTDPNPIPRVLWAIDFLPSAHGLLAIDFNTAPDLATLGETGAVPPLALREELELAAATAPATLRQF